MAEVRWSDHAMERLREQVRYIAEQSQSKEIAWKWANAVFDEVDALADFPNIGHRLPEFPSLPYREILARKQFRVIYRIIDGVCNIITIQRAAMLLDEDAIAELDDVKITFDPKTNTK